MSRRARQQRVAELLASSLGPDEQLVASGGAWYVPVRAGQRRFFVGRHYHLVALTSDRLVVWNRRAHPHRHSTPRLDAPLDALRFERGREALLLQVLAHADDGTMHVLEFRPRERDLGRALTSTRTG